MLSVGCDRNIDTMYVRSMYISFVAMAVCDCFFDMSWEIVKTTAARCGYGYFPKGHVSLPLE